MNAALVSAMTMRILLAVPIAVVLCCTMSHPRAFSQTQIEPFQPWTLCCKGTGDLARETPRGPPRMRQARQPFVVPRSCDKRDPETNECRRSSTGVAVGAEPR
jgi:hypothetical protein